MSINDTMSREEALDKFKTKYPELYNAVYRIGFSNGRSSGLSGQVKRGETMLKSNTENLPLEKRCQAEWDNDPDLRAEFLGDFELFMAYSKAQENGQIKILSSRVQRRS